MSEKKPVPVVLRAPERLCPVCGKPSYSPSGEHPQCSMARLSIAFKTKIKAAREQSKLLS